MSEVVDAGKTMLVPTACREDHGRHLPIDVDSETTPTIRDEVARDRDGVLSFPTVTNGDDPHHRHYPGAVTAGWETSSNGPTDIGTSLAHRGLDEVDELPGRETTDCHSVDRTGRDVEPFRPRENGALPTRDDG